MKQLKTISFFFVVLYFSCSPSSNDQLPEEEIWKLSWRMKENLRNMNYELANLQFDSLLDLNTPLEYQILISGLEVKSKEGTEQEILNILKKQSNETLIDICDFEFIKDLTPCKDIPQEKINNKNLQLQLVNMLITDQASRGNIMKEMIVKYNIDESKINLEGDIDEINRNQLKDIIKEYGFPTRKLVGTDGMNGIFYIIQHADGDKDWQKSQLKNIEEAVKRGDLDGSDYAYLYDRIQTNNDEKQRYGTQFSKVDPKNNIVELFETEDIENLDKRRMEVGIMPIEMYKKIMLQVYK